MDVCKRVYRIVGGLNVRMLTQCTMSHIKYDFNDLKI